jgi:hypothetical protein
MPSQAELLKDFYRSLDIVNRLVHALNFGRVRSCLSTFSSIGEAAREVNARRQLAANSRPGSRRRKIKESASRRGCLPASARFCGLGDETCA